MYVIATYRPFQWLKPISWINSATRQKQRTPYDHIAILKGGYVYESVVGKGVRKIHFDEWRKGREGTTLFMFKVQEIEYDMPTFNRLIGRKYDTPANLFNLFGLFKLLSFKADKRIQCAELIASMKMLDKPELYTPRKIVDLLRSERKKLKIEII